MVRLGSKMSDESRKKMSEAHKGVKRPELQKTVAQRLWAKCDKNGPIHNILGTRCWIWQGVKLKGMGYGQIQVEGRPRRVHRIAWELTCGTVPQEMWVLHKCDNPSCMRPDHLFLGSPQDNVDDMISKGRKRVQSGEARRKSLEGRLPKGESHWNHKLTDTQVDEIRRTHVRGERGKKGSGNTLELAEKYGVHPTHILAIARSIRRAK